MTPSPASPVTLRAVTENDLEMLREHRNRPDTRVWLGDSREITAEAQRDWFDSGMAQHTQIAVCDGVDVGLARVTHAPRSSARTALLPPSASVTSAWVGADVFHAHRGRGFGHRIFEAACDAAITCGARRLTLQVFLENAPALRVYQRAGFTFVADEPVRIYCRSTLLHAAGLLDVVRRAPTGLLHYEMMTKEVR